MLRRARLQGWEVPVVLLGIVLLSYGLWIPWMGLFGNDLPYLWYYHLLGPWGPGNFASIDRPFSAAFYAASTFLLGETVWPYHVFLLALRWLSAMLFWWVLGIVWPEQKRATAAAALLFAVYPGFRQNPISVEFILHFFVLDLFFVSLGAALLAASSSKRAWLLLAVSAFGAAGVFWLEYFIGLEVLRPVFLWIVTRRQGLRGRAQWKRVLVAWLPALAVTLAFLIWRVFIFAFPTYKPVLLSDLRAHPLVALANLGLRAASDLWTAFGRAWLQTLHLSTGLRTLLAYLALAAASVILVAFLSLRQRRYPSPAGYTWGETALSLGLLAMLAGGSIFWLTGIPVTLDFPWDRSTLALMPGASLALAGLLEMLLTPRYRPVIVAVLVALAVGMHFMNAQEYRAEWQKLKDFAWQITWRAPQIKEGTLGLFDVIPLNRYSDNDLTALLNWTYAPGLHSRQIPYAFFDLTLRMNSSEERAGLPGVEKGLPIERTHRGLTFKGSTSSTLALVYNPPACLRILRSDDEMLPDLPHRISTVLSMTSIDQIQAEGTQASPPGQFGPEPAHGWCYFFQKGELARQKGDWQAVAALGDQASAAGLQPADPSEYLTFIDGYLRAGNPERAGVLSEISHKEADLLPALCAVWKNAGSIPPNSLNCLP